MMRIVEDDAPEAFPDLDHSTFLRPNYREMAGRAVALPRQALRVAAHLSRHLGSFTLVDLIVALGDALPSGLYSGEGIEDYMRAALAQDGRSDDFRELASELYLVATDLDSCERIVFGAAGWDDIPISSAVRASTALPMVYKPHRVRDRELVDGGIVSTTNIDIAVEAGALFVVVVNPLVPYVGRGQRRISEMGFPKIGYQTFKLLAYQRLHELARTWERRYPGVDIVLIEPEPDDELMFQTNVLSYASRAEVARHGFGSVTLKLAREYDDLREVCRRHGIEISPARLRESA
jgi:predicted acylesterase/phospholipase RssA